MFVAILITIVISYATNTWTCVTILLRHTTDLIRYMSCLYLFILQFPRTLHNCSLIPWFTCTSVLIPWFTCISGLIPWFTCTSGLLPWFNWFWFCWSYFDSYPHLKPKPLVIVERFKFYKWLQCKEESVAEYSVMIKQFSTHCDFDSFLNDSLCD